MEVAFIFPLLSACSIVAESFTISSYVHTHTLALFLALAEVH